MVKRKTKLNCLDCNIDTWNEYYMIHDDLWYKIVSEDYYFNPIKIYLCILCLEKRLGFKLSKKDFSNCPANNFFKQTKILIDRLSN